MRVIDGDSARIDETRAKFLEQTDLEDCQHVIQHYRSDAYHAATARTAIYPDCQRGFRRRCVSRFKEPPEDMLIRSNISIARVALDIGIEFTYACRHLFVPDLDSSSAGLRSEICGGIHELCRNYITGDSKRDHHRNER